MRSLDQIEFMLAGGFTKRFHTVMTLREHTVAAHSYGVACLCYLLSNCDPSVNLLMAALTHDMAEQFVGDIPSPSKRGSTALKEHLDKLEGGFLFTNGLVFELDPKEKVILKTADIFDGMWNCIQERKLGNKGIEVAYHNFNSYATSILPPYNGGQVAQPVEWSIFDQLVKLWRKYDR